MALGTHEDSKLVESGREAADGHSAQYSVSSKSYWHMVRTLVRQQALSNAWLKAQGLVNVKDLWSKAQGYDN